MNEELPHHIPPEFEASYRKRMAKKWKVELLFNDHFNEFLENQEYDEIFWSLLKKLEEISKKKHEVKKVK